MSGKVSELVGTSQVESANQVGKCQSNETAPLVGESSAECRLDEGSIPSPALKDVGRSFLYAFGVALAVALIGRIGLAIMDVFGVLTYDYIAASTGTLLNQVCSALTGPALVAFMMLGGLVCALSVAAVLLYAYWYSRGVQRLASFGPALAAGAATTVAGLVCALVFANGIMSAVQMASMKTKLVMDGSMLLMGLMLIVAVVLLNAAACVVACACIARAKSPDRVGVGMIAAALVCGLVVMVIAVPAFASLNVAHINGLASAGWFTLAAGVNAAILVLAVQLADRALGVPKAPAASSGLGSH
ncbi:MAG: hypothetical protein VB027_00145 [Gordonibacter sp.]|nr:hypothetical protein [Gordonibacter sp.]